MRKYISGKAALTMSALALASALSAQAQVTTNDVSVTTFDPEASANGAYGYFYPEAATAVGSQSAQAQYYLPADAELTNAMWNFTFDLTALDGMTGYGAGTGGGLFVGNTTPDLFTKTNREDYIVSFDARVEGLAQGQTAGQAEMQIRFYYPDAETGTSVLSLQVNSGFAPTSQWKTFTYNLGEGNFAENTSERTFGANATNTTDLRFNVNFHEPHNRFGFDAENALLIDNVKIQVVDAPPVPVVETYGVPLLAWNFDDTNLWFEYHYQWSENGINPVTTVEANVNGALPNTLGKDETGGWMVNFDTTELANDPPDWAGGGTGGGGPTDYAQLNTNDLASYRIIFDGKVSGLLEGRTNTTAVVQVHFEAPDDTLTPPDDLTGNDKVLRLDFQIAGISTDWEPYSFTLGKGTVGEGSKENFTTYLTNISQLNLQWQIENLTSADWGLDAQNALHIDNVRLERLYPVESTGGNAGEIDAAIQGTNLVLTWNATNVRLQSTASLSSPDWQDVTGAASGYTTPLSGEHRFFRLVQNTAGQ